MGRVQRESLRFSLTLNSRSTASFMLRDETGAYDPAVGNLVEIYDNNGQAVFGGTIEDMTKTVMLDGKTGGTEFQINCVSHEQRLDKRVVRSKVYTSTTAGAVVTDLIATYAVGENIFTDGIADIQDGADVDKIVYDYDKRLSEALDELALMSNFVWYVDPGGYLFFVPRTTYLSPFTLTGAEIQDNKDSRRITITRSRSDLRNREFYRCNWAAFAEEYSFFNGDGSTRTFTLPDLVNRIERIALTPDGGATIEVSWGVEGVDSDKQYTYAPGSAVITQANTEAILTAGDTLEVWYRKLGGDVVEAVDTASIAARAAAEEGSGEYEHVTDDQNAVDAAVALQKAQALVDQYKSIALSVEFDTIKEGLRPGQVLTCSVTHPPVSGAWLVESIEGRVDLECGEDDYRYSVRIIDGSRIGGWLQFWEKLAGAVTNGGGISLNGSTSTPPEIPGTAALAGPVTGITLSYSYPDPYTATPDIAVECTPPGGTFAGVAVYLEQFDQSPLPMAVADGTTLADGSHAAGGDWKPRFLIRKEYAAGDRVVFALDELVFWERDIRVIVNSFNTDGVENPLVRPGEPGETPSATLTLEPIEIGPSGEEYCKNPTDISRTVTGAFEGPTHWTQMTHTWSGPVKGDGCYIEIMYHDVDGQERFEAAVGVGGRCTHKFQTPKTTQKARIRYFGFRDQFPGVEDDLVNTYAPGITPEYEETIGITSGTVDLGEGIAATVAASMAVLNKVLGVAPNGIDTSLIALFAVSQNRLANAQIIDAARIVDAAVQTAKIQDLAAISNKIADFAVVNAKIGSLAVDTAKIQNLAITNAKMAALSVGSANIQALAVGTAQIQDTAITTAKIQNAAITNALIANLAVSTAHIQDLAVTSAKIASLDVGKLTTGTMTVASTGQGIKVQFSTLYTEMLPTGFAVYGSGGVQSSTMTDNLLQVGRTGDAGRLQFFPTSAPTTTATGGAAGALPALPVGYLTVDIGGFNRKIPFYS